MANKHGSLSIDSDNLFPIIKKWLYSDHDIFYRELISNGCDAITKLKKLDMMGEYTLPADFKAKISVTVCHHPLFQFLLTSIPYLFQNVSSHMQIEYLAL